MTDYAGFRKSPDMTDWARSAQAQHFTKQLEAKLVTAHENLVATCNKSTDPKVTAAVTLWNELSTITAYFRNARKTEIE
jgi:hypothetical protein